jgi:PhnB protein
MGAGTYGDTISISVGPDSAEEGHRIFEAIAQGGQVSMPYERQFWGPDYGMCIDRFGVHWMVNYAAPE